ncbi:MAG TPA: hypothetical protein VL120_15145 [Solirubrobacteraceae bacterium]|jgi:uncharacterized cupredoxin-like copper-binding protein|nr:hypothetical protein [Solirubrobacteraceae bacterium]
MPVIEHEKPLERQETPVAPVSPPRSSPKKIAASAAALLLMGLAVVFAISHTGDGTSTSAVAPPAAAAPAPAPAVAPAASIGVTLREFTLAPDPSLGRAGRVTFKVANAGAIAHEFVVLRTTRPAASLLKGKKADETGNVGEVGDVQPGATKTLVLTLKPGHYALICNLPGHYQAGQRADFTVR